MFQYWYGFAMAAALYEDPSWEGDVDDEEIDKKEGKKIAVEDEEIDERETGTVLRRTLPFYKI